MKIHSIYLQVEYTRNFDLAKIWEALINTRRNLSINDEN